MSFHNYLFPYERVSPLLIPEIAGLICDVADSRDLLSLVLTCRVFYDAASARLWRTLHPRSLISLLKVKSTLEGKHRVKSLSCDYHQLIQTFRWSSRDDPTCRKFELEFFEYFGFPNLVQLEFSYMAAQSQTLYKIIAASPHLRYIDLSHCYCLSTQAILPLFFMPHHHLQTLILYGCGQIDPDTLATLIMHHHQSLQCIRLTDINDRVLESIQQCVGLKDLGLEHCAEAKLSAGALSRFSRPTKTYSGLGLERLRLRDIASLSSDHLRGIVDGSRYSLLHLDISECNRLSSEGFVYLSSQCVLLETLLLAYQAGVEDEAIQLLVLHCNRLKHLDVSGCRSLTDEAFRAFVNESDITPIALETLDVSGLESEISRSILGSLLMKLPYLREMSLGAAYDREDANKILEKVNRVHPSFHMDIDRTISRE